MEGNSENFFEKFLDTIDWTYDANAYSNLELLKECYYRQIKILAAITPKSKMNEFIEAMELRKGIVNDEILSYMH